MTMRMNVVGAVLAAVIGAALPAHGSTILVNGSFESGVPGNSRGIVNGANFNAMVTSGPNWDAWRGLNGWTLASGPGIAVETDRTNSKIDAQNGEYYVGLDVIGNSSLVQTVTLGVGRYTLSLWYSPDTGNAATNGIAYGITGLGSATATIGTNGAKRGDWSLLSLDLMVRVAGNYQVFLGATGKSDGKGGFIDNVALTPAPLPAAGLVLLGGLGALAGLRRRRRG
jgi:hypothetical protein